MDLQYQPQIQKSHTSVTYPVYRELNIENTNKHKLTIYFSEIFGVITKIWIFTSLGKVVERPDINLDTFQREYILETGHYIIRVEVNGQIHDNPIIVNRDTECSVGIEVSGIVLKTPPIYSSAPLNVEQYQNSSYHYYTAAAEEISKNKKENIFQKNSSGLFIFLRFPSKEYFNEKLKSKAYWKRFSLLDEKGEIVVKFPQYCITDNNDGTGNQDSGYLGFSESLPSGAYYLKYTDGKFSRIIPLYVYQNWHTQFFMTLALKPLFGSIRIFISKSSAFDPNEKSNLYTDICLDKLQNNDYTIDDHLLKNIAYRKFESPMLGILGAYLYLSSKETKDDNLFSIIVRNLKDDILRDNDESPDIWALNLLSYSHFGKTISGSEQVNINGTPLLRVAFDAMRKWAVKYPWIIPLESLNDYISESQIFDSPYNTFTSFNINKVLSQSKQELTRPNFNKNFTGDIIEEPIADELKSKFIQADMLESLRTPKDYMANNYLKSYQNASPKNWLESAVLNVLKFDNTISDSKLAEHLNMPLNTIERIKNRLIG